MSSHSDSKKPPEIEGFETKASFEASCDAEVDVVEVQRHGNWLTASAHIITAVIGAGVLSLSYAISWLGWVAGPILVLAFAYITLHTALLQANMYVINGKRHRTYQAAVETVFGRRGGIAIIWLQYSNLVLTAVAYNITGATSLQSIVQNQCRHTGAVDCWDSYWRFAVIFAGIQIFFTQIPNLDAAWWASAIATIMSFGYSFITLGLSIAEGNTHGTIGGRSASSADKAFGMFNALGAIVFAFSFAMVLIEIQDTIKDKPGMSATVSMKKAINVSMGVITMFFMAVGIAGYMAFGNQVAGDILTQFYSPLWLVQLANAMVVVHMFPAYQVFSQPVLQAIELWLKKQKWSPNTRSFTITFRIVFRSLYVVAVGVVAVCLPFFSDFVGLIGALGFWPLTIFFPIEAYRILYKPSKRIVWWLEAVSIFSFIVTVLAIIGSLQAIVRDAGSYSLFD